MVRGGRASTGHFTLVGAGDVTDPLVHGLEPVEILLAIKRCLLLD